MVEYLIKKLGSLGEKKQCCPINFIKVAMHNISNTPLFCKRGVHRHLPVGNAQKIVPPTSAIQLHNAAFSTG